MKLTLTDPDAVDVLIFCLARLRRHTDAGTPHKWNRPEGDDYLAADVSAYGAEIIVCQYLGRPWRWVLSPDRDGDGGVPGLQVRHSAHPFGRLLLHPEDNPEHAFVLVTGSSPTFDLVGWIRGFHGKQAAEWKALQPGRPCFVVERADLLPIETLEEGLARCEA